MRVTHFKSAEEFRAWLAKNHATAAELWVGFYKRSAGKKGTTYAEALEAREQHRTGIYSFEQKRPGLSAKHKNLFRANAKAWKFFSSQAPWYQRTAGYWVSSAKQEETQLRRLAALIEDSQNGRRIDRLNPKAKPKAIQ